jgi:hypothetical protein
MIACGLDFGTSYSAIGVARGETWRWRPSTTFRPAA